MKLIVKNEATHLAYLYENLPMSKKKIKKYLTLGSIFINNTKVQKYDYKLYPGMTIFIDTKAKKKHILPFDIIYEDNHIIVINKPSGLLTIATAKEKEKTLYHILREYLIQNKISKNLFIVHRLDKDTSGLVIFAKDEKTKNLLQDNWNELVLLREYCAVIYGNLQEKKSRIEQNLLETKTNLVYVSKNKDGKKAITDYEVLKENANYTLLDIKIHTGRKNQIRVAFSSLNHPIVGDKKYGLKEKNIPRLYLHANRLKLYYPYLKKELLFEIPIPKEFKNLVK